MDLRLGDARFDVVLCQQGLQFFPDKLVALRQMGSVLDRGGRLALSVWNNTGPYNGAVGEALGRFVGDEAAVRFCASRRAPGADELRRLSAQAGFSDVDVRVSRIDVHLPPPDRFTLEHLASTPVAPLVAAADPEARRQVAASVTRELQPYADGEGVTYPEETHVLTAHVH